MIPNYAKEVPSYVIYDIHVIGIECDHVNCSNQIKMLLKFRTIRHANSDRSYRHFNASFIINY